MLRSYGVAPANFIGVIVFPLLSRWHGPGNALGWAYLWVRQGSLMRRNVAMCLHMFLQIVGSVSEEAGRRGGCCCFCVNCTLALARLTHLILGLRNI